jgi:hypothetical protein
MNPPDAYIKTLVNNGWLGGVAFLAMIVALLLQGFPKTTRDWPFRDSAMVILASLIGFAAESIIIDTLRWRHLFVSRGMMSGLRILMRHREQPWRLSTQRLPGRVDHSPRAEMAR